MLFSDFLQIIAVLLEVAVMVIAAVIAVRRKKSYGWCIAVTFGLFVLFDIGRLFSLPVSDEAHALIFLVACGSMLYGVWLMYEEKRRAD
jgi:bacteriorhodopsin